MKNTLTKIALMGTLAWGLIGCEQSTKYDKDGNFSSSALPLNREPKILPKAISQYTNQAIPYFDGQKTNNLIVEYNEVLQGTNKNCSAYIDVNGIRITVYQKGLKGTLFLGDNGFEKNTDLSETVVSDGKAYVIVKNSNNEPKDRESYDKIISLYGNVRESLNQIRKENEKAAARPIKELLSKIPYNKQLEDADTNLSSEKIK